MNKITLILAFCLVIGKASTQSINRIFEKSDGSILLLGQVSIDRLKQDPFGGWYEESYENYKVNLPDEFRLPDSVTIFMGTWCGDSKREVPRLIKILEAARFDLNRLKIICVNSGFQNYKQAPEREEQGLNIHRVPTFILHDRTGAELGRIVEEPLISLESDIKTLMKGEKYETAYPIVHDLHQRLRQRTPDEVRKELKTLVVLYNPKIGRNSELNTYGKVLWSSFQLMEAEVVFELNALLFSDKPVAHAALARFKSSIGKYKEAIVSVEDGLLLDPNDKPLLELKEQLTKFL